MSQMSLKNRPTFKTRHMLHQNIQYVSKKVLNTENAFLGENYCEFLLLSGHCPNEAQMINALIENFNLLFTVENKLNMVEKVQTL